LDDLHVPNVLDSDLINSLGEQSLLVEYAAAGDFQATGMADHAPENQGEEADEANSATGDGNGIGWGSECEKDAAAEAQNDSKAEDEKCERLGAKHGLVCHHWHSGPAADGYPWQWLGRSRTRHIGGDLDCWKAVHVAVRARKRLSSLCLREFDRLWHFGMESLALGLIVVELAAYFRRLALSG
jgi:hypothetical protein